MGVSLERILAFHDGPLVGYFVGREEYGVNVAGYVRDDIFTAQAAELANLRATNMELVAQVARLTGERDADLLSAQQKALNRLADAVRIKDFLAACDALDAFDRAIKETQP